MGCWICGSENIRTFNDEFLEVRHHWIFLRKTDLQLLMFCNDCGMVGILVHEYENNYQRTYFGKHTGHYEATHVRPPGDYQREQRESMRKIEEEHGMHHDGFADYINLGKQYFWEKQKTPFNPNDTRFGMLIAAEYSDSSEKAPKVDIRGEYVVRFCLPPEGYVVERKLCIT